MKVSKTEIRFNLFFNNRKLVCQ